MKTGLVLLLCSLLTLLALSCREEKLITAPEDEPSLTAMDSGKNDVMVKGKVLTFPSPATELAFSFDAKSTNDDDDDDDDGDVLLDIGARGKFKHSETRSPDTEFEATVHARGQILCLQLIGMNRAKIGGRITYSSFEEGFPEGHDVIWSVTDDGGSGDTASQVLVVPPGVAEVYCAAGAPPPETPLEKGHIKIHVKTQDDDD